VTQEIGERQWEGWHGDLPQFQNLRSE
jgi:hypothetical protein